MKKISTDTETPLAQSFKGAPHTLNPTATSPFFSNKSRRYTNLVFFNLVLILLLFSPINKREISKSPHVRFLLVWSSLSYFPVHQPAATNSMHLQSASTPHLQHIQSEAHLESSRISAMKPFCGFWMRFCPIILFIYIKHWRNFLECLATFSGMFENIPRDVWGCFLECLARDSPEYNIPPFPAFPVPVFQVLYVVRIEAYR